ncbi:Fc.00g027710.m01.CDS01 [Cosmosporella sp. VM-42]
MVLVVIPALIPDIPKIYNIYFEAFKNEEMGRIMVDILFPQGIDDEFKNAHAAATLAYWHTSESQFTFKCVDTESGEIVGMGLGDLYLKPRSEEERRNLGVPWLEGAQRERAEAVLNPLWEAREKLLGGQPHIYCHVIAVDPKHQGKKAGALLCQYGIEMSERIQVPLYFESSPSTLGLYQKVGFELLKENVVHKAGLLGYPTDVTVPLMVRMPSAAGGLTLEEWHDQGYPKFTGKALDISALAALAAAGADKNPDLIAAMKARAAKTAGEGTKPTATAVETAVEIVS